MAEAYDQGKANTPTGKYVDRNIELFQRGDEFWDFGNAPLDPKFSNIGYNPSDLAPFFHELWTSGGFDPPALYTGDETSVEDETAVSAAGCRVALTSEGHPAHPIRIPARPS